MMHISVNRTLEEVDICNLNCDASHKMFSANSIDIVGISYCGMMDINM